MLEIKLLKVMTWSLVTAGNSSTPEWMRKHLKPGTPRATIALREKMFT